MRSRLILLLVAVLLLAFAMSVAQAEPFLPGPEAARLLADGKPWDGVRADGDHVRLTLDAGGTGRFEGPITRSVTWSIQGDTICIRIGFPLGAKCLRFRRAAKGLQSYEGDAPDLLLSR